MVCAKDVCDALEYKNPEKALRVHVSLEDKGVNEMVTPGGTQQAIFINESGLYPPPPLYGQQAEVMKRDLS